MRRLRRPAITLPTLSDGGAGERTADRHLEVRGTEPQAALSFPDHWNQPDVRGALYAMHGRACAYCQCGLPRNDRGDVEHFRPTALYWWLAYSFSNYLLSCSTCNRIRKRERFPLRADAERVTFANRSQIAAEPRLLIDPVADSVEEWLQTDFDDDLCQITVREELPVDSVAATRADATIHFFRFNRDPRLVKERIETVQDALEMLAEEPGDPAQRTTLRRMASRFAPHGISVRNLLEALAPELLPDPEEELRWWLDELVRELRLIDQLAPPGTDRGNLERARNEILWTLAVLWKDPPATEPDQVADWLRAAGYHDEVKELCDQL